MDIKHYEVDSNLTNIDIIDTLYRYKMYTNIGVFQDFYQYPREHLEDKAFISVLSAENVPISTIIFLNKHYYGWDRIYPHLRKTDGTIGFFTHPKFRNQGHVRKLFSEFHSYFKPGIIAADKSAYKILKDIPSTHKVFF